MPASNSSRNSRGEFKSEKIKKPTWPKKGPLMKAVSRPIKENRELKLTLLNEPLMRTVLKPIKENGELKLTLLNEPLIRTVLKPIKENGELKLTS